MENFKSQPAAAPFWKWGGFIFVLLVALDQWTKSMARNLFLNANFAFSLPVPLALMYAIYFVIIVAIIYYLSKNYHELSRIDFLAWIFVLSGAFANVGERLILGYVRDWIYITAFHLTGIYNLADGYILLGIILLLLAPKKY
jgi:lipoprotein signal peptidase